jgi:hypothetical protein
LPRYRKELLEIREIRKQELEEQSSDLDIDLTSEINFDMKEIKISYQVLVPNDHKYQK